MTIINQKAYKILENSIKKNSLSHFYIFHGPNNVGKKNLAISFAKLLFCKENTKDCLVSSETCINCKKIDDGKHYDLVIMDSKSPVDGVEDNKSDQIRLAHVQEINRIANLGPFMSEYKIFILDGAEKLNNEASNAFLKLLEEPPKSSIFLFLVNDLSSIYPTILSRAQKINILEISEEEMEKYISTNFDIDDSVIQKILQFSLGKIEIAEKLSSDTTLIDGYYESYDRFLEFCTSDISERMNFAQKFSTRFRTDRNAIFNELNLWIDFCKISLNNFYEDKNSQLFDTDLFDMFDTEEINNFVLELIKTISNLRSNANPRLVFDVMGLNLPVFQKEKLNGI